ncbi:ANTAR domain-containing response regulator [Streptomyces sp. NPDC050560]|uniref:ANTAR domain-containing response regulator n=1 Tax=Streptomyces sp. NPDC050560 TaxID=3365630 RepID=UPI003790CA77
MTPGPGASPPAQEPALAVRRLSELAEKAAFCTAGCCGASTTVSDTAAGRQAGVTHPDLSALVGVQLREGEGPIPAATASGDPVDSADLLREERWPAFRAVALDAGLRSHVTLPFRQGSLTVTLSLYGFRPGAFAAAGYASARALGELAAAGLARDRAYRGALAELDQMSAALRSRPVIDQACGIVMYVLGCDADDAFAVLRRISQGTNRKLADVAARVVESRGHGLENRLASLAPGAVPPPSPASGG